MQAFNAVYYSFSPQVATFIASHGFVRSVMKIILYPLIGILYVSNRMFAIFSFNAELGVLLSGIFAAFGIGAFYFGPLATVASRFIRKRYSSGYLSNKRLILVGCAISIVALILVEVIGTPSFLTATSVATVLSFLLLGAYSVWYSAERLTAKSAQ